MLIWTLLKSSLLSGVRTTPSIRRTLVTPVKKSEKRVISKFILEYQRVFRENDPVKELVPLQALGYESNLKILRPGDNIVDNIIEYIYYKSGIQTPKYNALYKGSFGVLQTRLNFVMKENNIPTGHFKLEESNSIIKNWNELSDRVGFNEKEKTQCIEGFDSIHSKSTNRYKKHILGVYLGKDIDRHGLASYEIWRRICFKRKMSRFSKEEEELILRRVEELGKSSQAFQVISKELGRFYSVSVKNRYKQLTQKSPIYRRGPFTPEEDNLILDEINKSGENAKAFNELAIRTGRRHGRNIKFRYYKLKYGTVAESKKEFTPSEQEELIRLILNEYPNTELRYTKPTDAFFTDLYRKFKRDSSILEKHWLKVILPALLSHELGLSNQNWQVPLIQTLLAWTKASKIRMARDIDYMELLELFPGQTKQSIQYFLTIMSRNIIRKVGTKDLTFQEILEEALRLNYSGKSPRITTIIRNNLLVEIYEKIKKSRQMEKESVKH